MIKTSGDGQKVLRVVQLMKNKAYQDRIKRASQASYTPEIKWSGKLVSRLNSEMYKVLLLSETSSSVN